MSREGSLISQSSSCGSWQQYENPQKLQVKPCPLNLVNLFNLQGGCIVITDERDERAEVASWDDVVWWLRENGLTEEEIAEIERKLREKR